MAVSLVRSAGSNFGDGLTNDATFSSVLVDAIGDYIYCFYVFRSNDAAEITPVPSWNGENFFEIVDTTINDANTVRLQVFGIRAASAGTHDLVAANSQFKIHAGGYGVFTGVHATVPRGTTHQQSVFTWGSQPSLTITDAVAGDLMVEIFTPIGWDDGFSDVTATTWGVANGQTQAFSVANSNLPAPRAILATKAGATGSQALGFTRTSGTDQPGYAHVAFALKQAASSASPVPRLNLYRRRRR
jgi:hypothetical protein